MKRILLLTLFLFFFYDNAWAEEYTLDTYQAQITNGRCEHHYIDKVDSKFKPILANYMKAVKGTKFTNPHMKYSEKANISLFKINGQSPDDVVENKNYASGSIGLKFEEIGGKCFAYLPDAYAEAFMFSDYKNGARKLKYGYVCDRTDSKPYSTKNYSYECHNKAQWAYAECITSIPKYMEGFQRIQEIAKCQQLFQNYPNAFCKPIITNHTKDFCFGNGFFIAQNLKGATVAVIPFSGEKDKQPSISPDMSNIPYKRVVEALLEKYGPATLSIRRTHHVKENECSDLSWVHTFAEKQELPAKCKQCKELKVYGDIGTTEKERDEYIECHNLLENECKDKQDTFISETYYWLVKPWVLRVQAIFPRNITKIVDDLPVMYLSTIFINWDNYATQDKLVDEAIKRAIQDEENARKAAAEEEKHKKEEKIKNFHL